MSTQDWKYAAEKQCDRCGDMYYHPKTVIEDYRQRAAEWEDIANQLKQQIAERDAAISDWKQEEESWNEQMKQLRTRLEDAEAALRIISKNKTDDCDLYTEGCDCDELAIKHFAKHAVEGKK